MSIYLNNRANSIVIRHDTEFSIWPECLPVPDHWEKEGFFGSDAACQNYIQKRSGARQSSLAQSESASAFLPIPETLASSSTRISFKNEWDDSGLGEGFVLLDEENNPEHETFFREMLGNIDEPTAPFGLLNVNAGSLEIGESRLAIEPSLASRLQAEAKKLGVTAASLFHLAWGLVLARTCGQDDVVFGTALYGCKQGGAGAHDNLWMFSNILPLRLSIDTTPVHEAVRQTQIRLAQLSLRAHTPLHLAQSCSSLRAPARLFTSLLNYRSCRTEAIYGSAAPCSGGIGEAFESQTNYPLTLTVDESDSGFDLTAHVPEQIRPGRIAAFMRTALEQLAFALETAPGASIAALDVLPADERRQVLYDWNATQAVSPAKHCIHELFELQAAQTPDAVAVIFKDVELSYATLNARANQLAHYLITLGVRPDVLVGIALERSATMVVALLATLKAGGGYVPLDPAYPAERLAFSIEDSTPNVLITEQSVLSHLPDLSGKLNVITLDAEDQPWAQMPASNPCAKSLGLTDSHLAYVIYTSGSTGKPKGVMVEHRNVVRLFAATQPWFRFGSSDIWTLFHSYAFDFAVWEMWGALLYGGRLIVVPRNIARSSLDFYRLVCEQGVTVLNQTPSAFRQFTAAQENCQQAHKLRTIIFGGEALDACSLKPWYSRNDASRTLLVNMYGITETTVHVTYRPLHPRDTDYLGGSPIGCRIPDLRIYILDAKGQPVPAGVTGELYVAGAGVARGYLNRPQLTAERFISDPFANECATGDPQNQAADIASRMYKTGDLGRWLPNGNIEFFGRNDHQVKIRGFRIEIGEIEAQLLNFPEVQGGIVLAREESSGDKRLVAYFTGSAGLNANALRAHMAKTLPEHMVPVAYVRLNALPLTPNGKLDRNALPAPQGTDFGTQSFEPPVGDIECAIAEIWGGLLHIKQIGRHDNFFALGGHSLMALRFAPLLERFLDRTISPAAIFDAPTPAALATFINSLGNQPRSDHIVPLVQSASGKPPLFIFHGSDGRLGDYVYLVNHLDLDRQVFGLELGPLEGRLGYDLTFEMMCERYVAEILKTNHEGPYWLCGFCFGGNVAYEVAQHLTARGLEVHLIMIDAYPVSQQRVMLGWILCQQEKIRKTGLFPSIIQRINKRISRSVDGDPDFDRLRKLDKVIKRYAYHPYDGPATLIICDEPNGWIAKMFPDKLNGWSKLLKGETKAAHIAGYHTEFLKDPTVQQVAAQIGIILQSGSAKSSASLERINP